MELEMNKFIMQMLQMPAVKSCPAYVKYLHQTKYTITCIVCTYANLVLLNYISSNKSSDIVIDLLL